MAIRTIKVYTCDTCQIEQLQKHSKGWLWAGNEQGSMTLPKVCVEDGTTYGDFQKFRGMYCSVLCFTVGIKIQLLGNVQVNELPVEGAEGVNVSE